MNQTRGTYLQKNIIQPPSELTMVDIQEIWVPCGKDEGQASRDGQSLKLAAIVANGIPLFLEKDVVLEKSQVADLQYQSMLKRFHTPVSEKEKPLGKWAGPDMNCSY